MTRPKSTYGKWDVQETAATQEMLDSIDRLYPNALVSNAILDKITTIIDRYLTMQLANGNYKQGESAYYPVRCGSAIGVATIYALKYLKQKKTLAGLERKIIILEEEKEMAKNKATEELADIFADAEGRN